MGHPDFCVSRCDHRLLCCLLGLCCLLQDERCLRRQAFSAARGQRADRFFASTLIFATQIKEICPTALKIPHRVERVLGRHFREREMKNCTKPPPYWLPVFPKRSPVRHRNRPSMKLLPGLDEAEQVHPVPRHGQGQGRPLVPRRSPASSRARLIRKVNCSPT